MKKKSENKSNPNEFDGDGVAYNNGTSKSDKITRKKIHFGFFDARNWDLCFINQSRLRCRRWTIRFVLSGERRRDMHFDCYGIKWRHRETMMKY